MSTFSISGKIIRQSNRKPIPKLYIEVWDKDGPHKEMLGSICFNQTVARNERGMASDAPSSAPASKGRSGVPPTAAEWEQLHTDR